LREAWGETSIHELEEVNAAGEVIGRVNPYSDYTEKGGTGPSFSYL